MGEYELRFHNAMPNWAKIIGLKIREIAPHEGGGFAVDREQATEVVKAVNMHGRLVDALKQAALELEEATKLIRGSTIDGTPMVNTAEIFERAAKRTRALLAEVENPNA